MSLLFLYAGPALGIERLGYVGQSWSFPWFSGPQKSSYENLTYHFDTAYFLKESWSTVLSFDTQVDGLKLFMLQFGTEVYLVPHLKVLPFLSARFIYNMLPDKDFGWVSYLGIETHIGKSHEVENFRLRVNTGGGQIFFNTGVETFVDLIRIGLVWCF